MYSSIAQGCKDHLHGKNSPNDINIEKERGWERLLNPMN